MQGLEDKRALTQRTSEVWWGIGSESGKFGICCASTLLPSAQSIGVYQITLTLLLALTYLLSSGKSSDWKAGGGFQPPPTEAHLPAWGAQREQTDRQTEGTLKTQHRIFGLVCEFAGEKGSGAYLLSDAEAQERRFCLPDLQMALWTQASTRDVKECQWDPPPHTHTPPPASLP